MPDVVTRARRGGVLRALGLMSGTSLDGVDLAVIETDGERIHALGPSLTVSYDEDIRNAVRAVFGARAPSQATDHAERLITRAHRDAVASFLGGDLGVRASDIDIIGFHGQTISHRPEQRVTWQIGDASWLAREIGVPVVADFRTADVAAGGQGAPLVPVYHRALVEQARHNAAWRLPVAVLNIGGVANVTWIGEGGELLAFDTGPGNAPLDDWVQRHGLGAFDADGNLSARGAVDWPRTKRVLSSSYFLRKPPKSLDRNDFMSSIVDGLSAEDGAATLACLCAAATSESIRFLPEPPTRWIVCGGGARNMFIINKLRDLSNILVEIDTPGWDGFALEAQAFGFLAVRSLRGLPLTFPTTTGVPLPLSGGRLFAA